jgi:glycosyltransferase involved in cell wall biosynthesis
MQIGLDFRSINWANGTGVHQYRDRLRHIVINTLQGANGVWLLRDQMGAVSDDENGEHVQHVVRADIFRKAQRLFRLTGRITQVDLGENLDIFHWSHPVPLRIKNCRNVYTVHDIIPITDPALSAIDPRRFAKLIQSLIGGDAAFTAVSNHSAKAFAGWTGIDPGRVSCTYQWVPQLSSQSDYPFDIGRMPYFLMLGRVEARKNIERTIAAWQQAGTGLPLVIAGPDGYWPDARKRSRTEILMNAPGVIRIGWTDNQTAARLISGCRALLMPSLAEGFGLPIAEALAAGVPAIAANSDIAREIGGDAVILVNPHDTSEIAAAICRVHTDEALRQQSIERGKIAARRFDAKNFADKLQNAYQHFL